MLNRRSPSKSILALLLGAFVLANVATIIAGGRSLLSSEECRGIGTHADQSNQGNVVGQAATTVNDCSGTQIDVRVWAWIEGTSHTRTEGEQNPDGRCFDLETDANAVTVAYKTGVYGIWQLGSSHSYTINSNTTNLSNKYLNLNAGQSPEEECESRPGEWIWLEEEELCSSDSPILIATGKGNSYTLTSAEQGVLFDIDGDGTAERVGWTAAETDVSFLAIDRDGDGFITSGRELFGNHTMLGATNGFDALRLMSLETNGGVTRAHVSSEDPLFEKLLLWTDRNHNGVSEPDELRPAASVLSDIGLGYEKHNRRDGSGNEFRFRGFAHVRTEPGRNAVKSPTEDRERQKHIYDVFFEVRR